MELKKKNFIFQINLMHKSHLDTFHGRQNKKLKLISLTVGVVHMNFVWKLFKATNLPRSLLINRLLYPGKILKVNSCIQITAICMFGSDWSTWSNITPPADTKLVDNVLLLKSIVLFQTPMNCKIILSVCWWKIEGITTDGILGICSWNFGKWNF